MNSLTRFANKFGGRLDLDIDTPELPWLKFVRDVAQRCEDSLTRPRVYLKRPRSLDLEFCFTMEKSFNAHCGIESDRGCIAISVLSVSKLLQAARSVVTGGARLLSSDREVIPFRQMNANQLLEDGTLYEGLPDPNDDYLARNAVYIAIDIMLNHELAHLANGHLGWSKRRFGITEFEGLQAENSEVDDITHQTLEWDADVLAIQRALIRGLGVSLREPGENEGKYTGMPGYGRYGSWDQCLYSFGIGIYLLTRFFKTTDLSEKARVLYPPVWFRVQHALSMIPHTVLSRIIPLSEEVFENRIIPPMVEGATRAEKVWCEATGEYPVLPDLFEKERLDMAWKLVDSYNLCWKSISPALDEHRLIPSVWDAV